MTVTLVPRDHRDPPRIYRDIVEVYCDEFSWSFKHADGNIVRVAARVFWQDVFYVE